MNALTAVCRCGHQQEVHDHFRRGSDCGICGAATCRKFALATTPYLTVTDAPSRVMATANTG